MRYQSYLNTAKEIISNYDGTGPLSFFLKKKFASDKKFGSSDRKQITTICYYYYRLGRALQNMSVEERIMAGLFLCEKFPSELLKNIQPVWNELVTQPLQQKTELLNFRLEEIFPYNDELSPGIDHHEFCASFLQQPDLYPRIRPGKKEYIIAILKEAGIVVELKGENCIAIPNSTKLDNLMVLDRDAVIQDLNSQKVLDHLNLQPPCSNTQHPFFVWDCCAASGGKSILAYDLLGDTIELTVSDIRQKILQNLKERFDRAGILTYRSLIADLTNKSFTPPAKAYKLIICDAPCTGSGTWGRTPEQLHFFRQEMINEYAEKQKKIVSNAIPYLQEGGFFCYITCSVFRKENEDVMEYIQKEFHLRLINKELLKGYDQRADTLFTSLFKK